MRSNLSLKANLGFVAALTLLLGLCGIARSGWAQQARPAPHTYRSLSFTRLKGYSAGALDSLVVVKPIRNGVGIIVTYNNPCNVRPIGRYRLSSDTLFVLLRYRPALPANAACPGVYIPEEFAAHIEPLRATRYTVRVVFRGRLLPEQPIWRDVEVK